MPLRPLRSAGRVAPLLLAACLRWWEERDQNGVMVRQGAPSDYFGVRDVESGLTHVEYETGEVELYDLDVDPWQLDNRADEPAYAGTRAALAGRLAALVARP